MAETNFDRRKSKTSLFSLVFLTKKSDIKEKENIYPSENLDEKTFEIKRRSSSRA